MRFTQLVQALTLAAFGAGIMSSPLTAEILPPPSINGAYPTGTVTPPTNQNLGGSTNNTTATGTLTNLGSFAGTSFTATGTIVRQNNTSPAVWGQGMWFPDINTLRLQPINTYETNRTTGSPTGAPGYANYNIQFNQAVNGLRFNWVGIDNGDNVEVFAYLGGVPVPIAGSYVTLNGPEISFYTPTIDRFNAGSGAATNAIGIRAIPTTSGPNSGFGVTTSASFVFPLGVQVDQIVVRSGKSSNVNASGATTQISGMQWDVVTTLQVNTISNGGVGPFSFTANNGLTTPEVLTTTTAGVAVNGAARTLTNASVATTITEAAVPGYVMTGATCTGMGAGGTATVNTSTRTVVLDAAAVAPGSNVVCTVTNAKLPTITLSKTSNNGSGSFTFNGTNGFGASQIITTPSAGSTASGTARTLAAINTATTITETIPTNWVLDSVTCTGMGAGGSATPNLAGGSVTLNAAATAAGSDISCTFTDRRISPIDAVNDAPAAVNGFTGATIPTVLTNDTMNGVALVPGQFTLTPGTAPTPAVGSIAMQPNGTIIVAPGTTAGTYLYDYTICEVFNPTNCDTATATVIVTAPAIDAVVDDFTPTPVNGFAGGATTSVLANDTINGTTPASLSNVTLTPGAAPNASLSMNADGTITVDPGTAAGTYLYPYTICDIANPTTVCDTATATVVVSAAPIDAVNDGPTAISTVSGGTTATSVLANDTLNNAPVDPDDVTLTSSGTAQDGTTTLGLLGGPPAAGAITMDGNGLITVDIGTTPGSYSYLYEICEDLNPTNCDIATATITVTPPPINAVDDAPAAINGFAGGSAPSVFGNDTLNGASFANSAVVMTVTVAPTNAGVTVNTTTGVASVAAGTAAGSYPFTYEICEVGNLTNCDTAVATIVVAPPVIDAVNDTPTAINGYVGGTTASVFANDTLNSASFANAAVTMTIVTPPVTAPAAGSITPNLTTGVFTVAAGTTAGTYVYTYRICQVLNPTNCDTATATITVNPPVIDAVIDDFTATPVNGYVGGTTASVRLNDTLNGATVVPAQITLSPGTSPLAGITMNAAGVITVAAGTPAGTYSFPYTICEIVNPTNCDNTTAAVLVNPPAIVADDDDFTATPVNGFVGGNAGNVLTNDRLNGAVVNPAQTTITILDTDGLTGVTISDAGVLTVPAGTPAGTYLVEYNLCEDLNAGLPNCDTAIARVVVSAPAINAVNDTPTAISGFTGGATASVFTNDTLNSAPFANAAVTMTIVTPPVTPPASGSITPNLATGVFTVAAGTTAGSYQYTYQICQVLNPTNCDTATVTVTVNPPVINALPETSPSFNGSTEPTGTIMNVLTSDLIGGVAATTANVTITPASITVLDENNALYAEITVDAATGDVTFTGPGGGAVVSITYEICDIVNPTVCDTQVETVFVLPLDLQAQPETFDPINGLVGGDVTVGSNPATIIDSDTVDLAPATLATVTITTPTAADYTDLVNGGTVTFLTLDPLTGIINVAANTPAGSYGVFYEICDPLQPTRCDSLIETVTVTAAPINAVNDTPTAISGFTGGPTDSVFDNDTLNGLPFADAAVDLTIVTPPVTAPAAGSITLDLDTGVFTVAAGTTAGTYVYTYQICEDLNPTNCDTATATVVVTPPVIVAEDDDFSGVPVNGANGGTAGNVLNANPDFTDTLNGVAVNPALTTITIVDTDGLTGVTISDTGVLTVPAGTPANTYLVEYRLCEDLNPTNCDTAIATVVVEPAIIDAVDDEGTVANGANGGTAVPNVLVNDTLNGAPATLSNVTLSQVSTTNPNVTLNPATGAVSVAPGTAAGTYTVTYEICEQLNPTNCDTTTATITVGAAVIDAVNDTGTVASGATGGTGVANVLVNDLMNGAPATLSNVTLSQVSTTNPNVTLNPATGAVSVAPGTAAGTYTVIYQICEQLNSTNCDTATATITVGAAVIDAVNDTGTVASGATGGTAVANVLVNDTLNGAPATLSNVTLSQVSTTNPNVTLNPATGAVSVAPGTPAGPYTVTYRICEQLNSTNCDTATAVVTVGAAPIDAVNDAPAPINGYEGGTTASVLVNDTLNGVAATLATVTLSPGISPSGLISMELDGTITVDPGIAAGTYLFPYTICEQLNSTNCDTATATVVIDPAPIDAVDDGPTTVNGYDGDTTDSVLDNDTLNGAQVVPSEVTLASSGTASDGTTALGLAVDPVDGSITMELDGSITVSAGTTAGTYTYTYEICENLNPTNCDIAIATIEVEPPVIDAVDDTPVALNGYEGDTTSESVLDNDLLNGALVIPTEVTLVSTGTASDGTTPLGLTAAPIAGSVTMNADGTITVAGGTTAGTYFYTYEICEVLNPDNCDTAVATVVVDAAPIDAVDDAPVAIASSLGGNTASVLNNDTLNGVGLNPSEVTLTPLTAPVPTVGSIQMNSDGTITVAAGTTAGTYTYDYTICENLNLSNCDTATATITVAPPVIDAVDDAYPPVVTTAGTTLPTVLVNDTIDDVLVDPADVLLTPGVPPSAALGSLTMNPDGTITIAPNTAPGTYVYPYRICEALNPSNCDIANATIVIGLPGTTELVDDVSNGNIPGTPVTIRVIRNDADPNDIFDPTTLQITGTPAPGEPLVVPGEGTWSVDLATSTITFTPEPGFRGDPTPIQYYLSDNFGNQLAPASIVVTYEENPAFVCSDVIGKVFEDKNQNGAQDEGEKGLGGVRIVTVNGQIITTDKHGRYSVPCAAIPRDIGSTFLLKLDTRSLPTGYRVTTENPKTVRLTPGMMRKMNFGVSLSNLVNIDLDTRAFDAKTGEMTEDLDKGLKTLVATIAKTPSVVRLTYHVTSTSKASIELAEDRLEMIEDRLRELWRGRARYKLNLEITIVGPNGEEQ